jgi:hypothetical protein
MSTLKSLSLSFSLPLYTRQIPQWRGAFNEMAGWEHDHFHNHRGDDGYHYRYPRIQYRVRRGKAALFAVNEGVEALQQVLASSSWELNWQGEKVKLMVEDLRMNEHEIRLLSQPRTYKIFRYVALNEENYEKWRKADGYQERGHILETCLRNHLLSCLWGLGWEGEEEIRVRLQEIRRSPNY